MPGHCILCNETVDGDFETHINERHSDPTPKDRDVEGVVQSMTDADYVRLNQNVRKSGGQVVAAATAAPTQTILEAVGIRVEDIEAVETEVDAGASCSESEVKKVFEGIDSWAGFKVDRAHFVVNFVDWGFRTSFSEELTEAGGWTVRSAATSGDVRKFAKASELHSAIRDALASSGTGRDFTFRRLGRYFGPTIPNMVAKNKSLQKYQKYGTDMSNKFGIAPNLFLTCTSIFESIKPYAKWSDEELAAWSAHNLAARKSARDSRRNPQDLRIDPEMAENRRDSGFSDFSHRMADRYGKGQAMFEDMWSGSGTRGASDRRGLGS